MAYLVKDCGTNRNFGPLDNHILTYLITLGDSLRKIEQSEGYTKGKLDERVKFELGCANTFAKHLEGIFGIAGMEIAEEYAKNYKFLRIGLGVFNHLYNPSLIISK